MKKLQALIFTAAWLCGATHLHARAGKVFFSSDRWLKGDIQTQTDESGREMVVVAMNSGSVMVPKSEIKTIVFSPNSRPSDHQDFYRALENTPSAGAIQYSAVPSLYEPYIRVASKKHQMIERVIGKITYSIC